MMPEATCEALSGVAQQVADISIEIRDGLRGRKRLDKEIDIAQDEVPGLAVDRLKGVMIELWYASFKDGFEIAEDLLAKEYGLLGLAPPLVGTG